MTLERVKLGAATLLFLAGAVLWMPSVTGESDAVTVAPEPVQLTSLVQPLEASFHAEPFEDVGARAEPVGVFVLPVGNCPPPLIAVDAYTHLLQELLPAEEAEGLVIALVNEDERVAERYARILELPLPVVTARKMEELVRSSREEVPIGLYLQPPGEPLRYVPLIPGIASDQRQKLLTYAVEGFSL